jgi:hypothetical protein
MDTHIGTHMDTHRQLSNMLMEDAQEDMAQYDSKVRLGVVTFIFLI